MCSGLVEVGLMTNAMAENTQFCHVFPDSVRQILCRGSRVCRKGNSISQSQLYYYTYSEMSKVQTFPVSLRITPASSYGEGSCFSHSAEKFSSVNFHSIAVKFDSISGKRRRDSTVRDTYSQQKMAPFV